MASNAGTTYQKEKFAVPWEIGFLVKAVSALVQDVKLGQDHF